MKFCSGTKLFITFLSLRFFDMRRERHTQFLSKLTFPSDPTTCGTFRRPQKSTIFCKTRISTNCFLCFFFKFQHPPLLGMTSFTSPVSLSVWVFYCDISYCHIRPRAREHLHSTNPMH